MIKWNEMLRKNKEFLYLFLGILAFSCIICSGFLQPHYSSDTFVLMNEGYFDYVKNHFLVDGRLISSIVCLLGGVLNLPYTVYIVTMDLIGIIILSVSVVLIFTTILKLVPTNKIWYKTIILVSTYTFVFSQFGLEYLLYPESSVMCLSLLLVICAAKRTIAKKKHHYLETLLFLILATFCYQGVLTVFPVLFFLFYIIKQLKEKGKWKEHFKEIILEGLKYFAILIVAILINTLFVQIIVNVFEKDVSKISILVGNKDRWIEKFNIILQLWNYSNNMLIPHFNTIIVVISLILLLLTRDSKEIIIKYIILNLLTLLTCFNFVLFTYVGFCERVVLPITQTLGMSMIILSCVLIQKDNIINLNIKKAIFSFILICFIFNSFMAVRNIGQHIEANRIDEIMGNLIYSKLEEYEKNTGIRVTKVAYYGDSNLTRYEKGIKHMNSLTERKILPPWCINEAINYYCNRKLDRVPMLNVIQDKNFKVNREDEHHFRENQVQFCDDIMVLKIY